MSPNTAIACFSSITTFANEAIQSAATTYARFHGAMKDILPKLNQEEQNLCFDTFSEYHELLMTTQRFVTRTLVRVRRALRTNELLASIDLQSITALCGQIRGLLDRFRKIQAIIAAKITDERKLQNCRNVFLGLMALAEVVCLIAASVGVGPAFIAGTIAGIGAAGGILTHIAQKVSSFELAMKNLQDTEASLGKMSQNYVKIEAMGDLLDENDDGSKSEFIRLLNELQVQTDKGFSLLTKI